MPMPLLALFFLSGFAALVYQVLWQRQLGLIFGNGAHAAATTLAIFFAGLAIGSWLWGERAARSARPLAGYARLELGLALTALVFFALLPLQRAAYGPLFAVLGEWPGAFAVARALLAATLLLPPALCLGGTLPMLAQHLIRDPRALGRIATRLYAVNTLGGAAGALAAGFWLPGLLGVRAAYLLAVALNAAIGILALLLDRTTPAPRAAVPTPADAPSAPRAAAAAGLLPGRQLHALAALSGFVTLGLEVLWTRMFAQVLHNSVYSFTVILVTFLLALALGAGLARAVCRRLTHPDAALVPLLLAAGGAAALSPFVFAAATDGLAYLAPEARWYAYLGAVFGLAAVVMLVPGLLAGAVLPTLWHLAADRGGGPGRIVGRLAAVNTAGAIAGALICGFVLLDGIGLWASVKALALLQLAAAAWLAATRPPRPAWTLAAALGAMLAFATVLDPTRLPLVRVAAGEAVLERWESAYGVTAVVQRGQTRRIKMDNYYALGGTGALVYEQTQADLPLVLHSAPRSAFFLGLGSGITAGAALQHPLERIAVAELVPEVVEAARRHFGPYINGLFEDARARVVVADGRSYLFGDPARYDVVVGDLFIPWQAGAGALYTREQFATARARLTGDGLFAQWLPLYQLSRAEFRVIARTMLEVFPQVTLWRGDFLSARPIVALIGHNQATPLQPERVLENFRRRQGGETAPRDNVLALTGLFYAGNLGANRDLFADAVINTDDRPVIEYASPITQREQRAGAARWFTGEALQAFYDELATRLPPARDPYLALLSERERGYVDAGRARFASKVAREHGRVEEADRHADAFGALVPFDVLMMFDEQGR